MLLSPRAFGRRLLAVGFSGPTKEEKTMIAAQTQVKHETRLMGSGIPYPVVCSLVAALLAVLLYALPAAAQTGTKAGEWRFYGGDSGSTKYSPLDQINRNKVKDLQIVWRWKT